MIKAHSEYVKKMKSNIPPALRNYGSFLTYEALFGRDNLTAWQELEDLEMMEDLNRYKEDQKIYDNTSRRIKRNKTISRR